jgi:hypothetical protein
VGAALVVANSSKKGGERSEGPWWTLDSGCTDHMTGNRDTLSNYREVKTPWTITIAD